MFYFIHKGDGYSVSALDFDTMKLRTLYSFSEEDGTPVSLAVD